MLKLLLLALGLWCLICWITALLSGWARLAGRFHMQQEPYGDTRTVSPWLCAVRTRWGTHYNGMVRLRTASDGLYLAVILPLRPGHPPLRIPWNELTVRRKHKLFGSEVLLVCGQREQIVFRIAEKTAASLGLREHMHRD